MTKASMLVSSLTGILCVLGIAFSLRFIFAGGGNDAFADYPTITRLHVIPGILYLALAPLQFLSSIRKRSPTYHRWAGRLLAAIGLVLGAAALFLGLVIPFSGLAEQVVIAFFGTFFLLSIVKGVESARARQFAAHREWMLRAFAIGLSIVTMRLIFIPILVGIGTPSHEQIVFYSIFSFTISFIAHSVFAELWIRYTRRGTNTPHTSPEAARSPAPGH